ncbi:hypothetical protein GCM10023195_24120 [Actinoallomurus liliacearum]|uniref:Secreted protein n=1 Tax=Actinoallomurus liliacearum TaxID=1080073 RepID=A0ABP8TIQ8_9ACTN
MPDSLRGGGRWTTTVAACALVHAPVRVTAEGRWNGGFRRYTRTFFNRCAAIRATGGVIFVC